MTNSKELALRVRRHTLGMAHRAKAAHLASCLSVTDILAVLYSGVLRVRSEEPDWCDRDRFILSKGHGAMALYATLAECGFFPVEELQEYGQTESRLCGHVHSDVPGVEVITGSLGHGLSIGCGMALAAKAGGKRWRVFVVLSDGEYDEGSSWEATLFAAHHRLHNLVAIVDRNRLQACGRTEDVLGLEPFGAKLAAFGWDVETVDGHNHAALAGALQHCHPQRPRIIIAETVKAKGWKRVEDSVESHYVWPSEVDLMEFVQG